MSNKTLIDIDEMDKAVLRYVRETGGSVTDFCADMGHSDAYLASLSNRRRERNDGAVGVRKVTLNKFEKPLARIGLAPADIEVPPDDPRREQSADNPADPSAVPSARPVEPEEQPDEQPEQPEPADAADSWYGRNDVAAYLEARIDEIPGIDIRVAVETYVQSNERIPFDAVQRLFRLLLAIDAGLIVARTRDWEEYMRSHEIPIRHPEPAQDTAFPEPPPYNGASEDDPEAEQPAAPDATPAYRYSLVVHEPVTLKIEVVEQLTIINERPDVKHGGAGAKGESGNGR